MSWARHEALRATFGNEGELQSLAPRNWTFDIPTLI